MEKKTIIIDADVSKAQKNLKKTEKTTKDLTKSTGFANKGILGMAKGFKAVGVALKAAGIGLIIGAFMTLKEMLTGNIETARKLEVIWKQLTTVIAVIGDRIADLINGTKNLSNVFKGMGQEARNEAKAMRELTLAIQGVRDAERELVVQRAKADLQIAKSRLLAEDETKSKEERKNALLNAIKVEEEVAEREKDLAVQRMKNMEQEIELGRSSEEEFDQLAQLKANIIRLETASVLRKKRVVTEVNTFDREIAAEQKARAKDVGGSVSGSVKKQVDAYEKLLETLQKIKEGEGNIFVLEEEIAKIRKQVVTETEKLDKTINKKHRSEKQGVGTIKENIKLKKEEISLVEKEIKKREDRISNIKEQNNVEFKNFNDLRKKISEASSRYDYLEKIRFENGSAENIKAFEKQSILLSNLRNSFTQMKDVNFSFNEESLNNELETLQAELAALEGSISKKISRNKNANKKLSEQQKEAGEKRKDLLTKEEEAIVRLKERSVVKMREAIAVGEEKELNDLFDRNEKLFNMIKGEKEAELELEEWFWGEYFKITDKFYNQDLAKQKEIDDKKLAQKTETFNKELEIQQRSFAVATSFASSLESLAGEDIKRQKNAALLGVAIDTASSLMSAYKIAFKTPGANPVSVPLVIAELAAILFSGVAQARGILAKVPGEGGDDLQSLQGGIGLGGGNVPSLPGDNNLDMDMAPVQAFVVESNVTSKQALQNDLEIQATL